MPGHSKLQTILDSSSSGTSPATFIGDCRLVTVSVQTSTGSTSVVTVSLSNDHGLNAAVGFWSVATVLPSRGIFTIDAGARWIQVERGNIATGSAASITSVLLNRYYE